MKQQQFLNVIPKAEAWKRFIHHLQMKPLGTETVLLAESLGRVLADNICSEVDVTSFDRSNVDGFALCASDTYGASEESPRFISVNVETLSPGTPPQNLVHAGKGTSIATGAMLPRGADAVIMIEQTEIVNDDEGLTLEIRHSVAPGENITFAGTDIARGETTLRINQLITSREIGLLAAIGLTEVEVYRRPRVAIISTGNEIVPPGEPCPPGYVYDSNAAILTAAVSEAGGKPICLGIVRDDLVELKKSIETALQYDMIVLSGGTSKGAGDLTYRAVSNMLDAPGIVAHGVSLKPGKPICLAVSGETPVVVLPGFPTSAVFTFHEFVVPVIHAFAGRQITAHETVLARLPVRVNSARGRTEYLLVSLIDGPSGQVAYPMNKGSGSVTTFSQADGFITIDQHEEMIDAERHVNVKLLSNGIKAADLVVIGSHCLGLDYLLGEMQKSGFSTKALYIGSMGGLNAAKRAECDVAGIHLLDEKTGTYNQHLLSEELQCLSGYLRMQSIVYRADDPRFQNLSVDEFLQAVLADPECRMINRNHGSGTRIVIDQLLQGAQPAGYPVQVKTHNAVATAIDQHRADWGVATQMVADLYQLNSLAVQQEQFDFVIPESKSKKPAVIAFCELLKQPEVRTELARLGLQCIG